MKRLITALLLTVVAAVPAFAKEPMNMQNCRNTEGLTTTKTSETFGRPDKYMDYSIQYYNDDVYAELNKKAISITHAICIPLKPEQQVKAFPVPIKPLPASEVEAVKKSLPEISKLAEAVNKGMNNERAFKYFKAFVATLPDKSFLATKDYYTLPRFYMQSVKEALSEAGYTLNQTGETTLVATKYGFNFNLYIPSKAGQNHASRTAKLESIVIGGKTYFITVKEQLENGKAYEAYVATQKIIATNDIGKGERMDLLANYREYGLSFQHNIGKGKVLLIHNNDGIADIKE